MVYKLYLTKLLKKKNAKHSLGDQWAARAENPLTQ